MTRVLTEGFEFGDVVCCSGSVVGATATTTPRSGAYSLFCAQNNMAKFDIPPLDSLYFRFALRSSAPGTVSKIFCWQNSSAELGSIRYTASRQLGIYSGSVLVSTGTLELQNNIWYLVEGFVSINDTTGNITIKVDGVLDSTFTGDTKPGAQTTVDRIVFQNTAFINTYFDDVGVNSTAGTSDNSWLGNGFIVCLNPSTNGSSTQLLGSDGNSVDNYALVDETPYNTTDYVSGSVAGIYDLYKITDFSNPRTTIGRVWAEARALDPNASGSYFSVGIMGGSSIFWSASLLLTGAYSNVSYTTGGSGFSGSGFTTNPFTGLPWSSSDIDDLQCGVKAL